MNEKMMKITLIKSPISQKPAIRRTISALGLKLIRSSTIKTTRPEILGMVKTVAHMVRVEEIKS
jgi:large subunit ribosomal protein L30